MVDFSIDCSDKTMILYSRSNRRQANPYSYCALRTVIRIH